MKKLVKILVVIMILTLSLGLFACRGEEGRVTLVVKGTQIKTYTVDTTGKELSTLQDLMDYLEENEEFLYTVESGMVSEINGRVANGANREFWGIYTDLKIGEIPYFDNSWGTASIDGKTYGSALKGINELPLSGGFTYLFEIATW